MNAVRSLIMFCSWSAFLKVSPQLCKQNICRECVICFADCHLCVWEKKCRKQGCQGHHTPACLHVFQKQEDTVLHCDEVGVSRRDLYDEHVNIFSPEQNDIVQICANKSFNCIKKKIKSTHIWRCAVTNFVCEKGLVCLNNTAVTKASVAQIYCEWCIKPTSTPNDERLHTKTHTCTQLNKHYTTGTLMMFSHVPLMFLASWSKLLFSGIVVILLL